MRYGVNSFRILIRYILRQLIFLMIHIDYSENKYGRLWLRK